MRRLMPRRIVGGLVVMAVVSSATAQEARMGRANLNGVELDYQIQGAGAGEPVVLVHAGVFASWFTPLLSKTALTSRYRVVSYHRVGYAGSSRVAGPVSIAQQASHLRALMRHLGIERAHLVGHSSGGNIILQAALDAPETVASLAVLEPALTVVKSAAQRGPAMAAVVERVRAGDKPGAVDAFMRAVAGPTYRTGLDKTLPGAFDQGVADADTFFGQEWPAIQQWSFRREDAGRITRPVLAVIGEKNKELSPVWNERQEMLLTWLPNAEPFVLPGATHLLHVENPRGMAEGLAAFFARHPLGRTGP
jgi:pimeloyl-ACP methyl ester carboxylesterase